MEDDNVKLLSKIIIVVLIIIFGIIILSLVNYVFSVNGHEYELPTTTTKYVDTDLKKISEGDRINYNNKLNDKKFLISLGNAVSDKLKYQNVNLIESEEAKFKFIYTKLKMEQPDGSIDYAMVNRTSNTIFNVDLAEANLTSYYDENGFYNFSANLSDPMYCMKAVKSKIMGKKTIVIIDLVNYGIPECNNNYLDYENDKVVSKAQIDATLKNDGTYYLSSFMILE